MPNKPAWLSTHNLFIAGYSLALLGMLFSRAALSVSMILIIAASLLQADRRIRWGNYCTNPIVIGFFVLFVLVAISGFYSENMPAFWERLRIKLPFLLLPLAVLSFKPLTARAYFSLLYLFFLMMFGYAVYQSAYLATHYSEVLEMYSKAQVLPSLISHIQLSIMMALAVVLGGYLYLKGFHLFHAAEKYLLAIGTLFLFVFVHVVAVRSGLLALYLAIFALGIRYIFVSRRYAVALVGLLVLLSLPVVGFYTMPTLRNKVYYMRHDLLRFKHGELEGQYSDTRRLTSITVGIKAGNTSPVIGVGYGDIETATKSIYNQLYPNIVPGDYLTPHNQFVYVYVGLGWIGLVTFLAAIFIPVFYHKAWHDPLVLSVNIMLISSFLTEHTIEVQIGVALYLLFLLLVWKRFMDEKLNRAHP